MLIVSTAKGSNHSPLFSSFQRDLISSKILPLPRLYPVLSSFTRDPTPHPFLGSFPTITQPLLGSFPGWLPGFYNPLGQRSGLVRLGRLSSRIVFFLCPDYQSGLSSSITPDLIRHLFEEEGSTTCSVLAAVSASIPRYALPPACFLAV